MSAFATQSSEREKSRAAPEPRSGANNLKAVQGGASAGMPLYLRAKLKVSRSTDPQEQEADRVAEAVVRDQTPPRLSAAEGLQREEKKAPADTNDEQYKKAAEKTAEALLETEAGKKIKENAEALATTLPGMVLVGTAAAAVVTKAAVKNEALPLQPPAIPLDKVGLANVKMQLTWEGPVRNPTKAMIVFSGTFGRAGGKQKEKQTASEKMRSETARLAKEQYEFRESLKTSEQRAEEERTMMNWVLSQSHLGIPGLKPLQAAGEALPAPAREESEMQPVQRKEAAAGSSPLVAPAKVDDVVRSPGRPLDPVTRAFFERRLASDFSQVRVHNDSAAAESARAVGARAYAVGNHVAFEAGEYTPETYDGRKLIAHELAHTVQQRFGVSHPAGLNAHSER